MSSEPPLRYIFASRDPGYAVIPFLDAPSPEPPAPFGQ